MQVYVICVFGTYIAASWKLFTCFNIFLYIFFNFTPEITVGFKSIRIIRERKHFFQKAAESWPEDKSWSLMLHLLKKRNLRCLQLHLIDVPYRTVSIFLGILYENIRVILSLETRLVPKNWTLLRDFGPTQAHFYFFLFFIAFIDVLEIFQSIRQLLLYFRRV